MYFTGAVTCIQWVVVKNQWWIGSKLQPTWVELEAGRLVQGCLYFRHYVKCMLYLNSAIAVCPLSLQYYASVGSSKHMFIFIEVVMKFVKLDKEQCITYIVKCASQFFSLSYETAYMKLQTKLGHCPCSFLCTTQWKDFLKKLVLTQQVKKLTTFLEISGSFSCSQQPVTCSYHLNRWILYAFPHHSVSRRSILMLFSRLCVSLQSGLYPSDLPTKPRLYFMLFMCVHYLVII